MLKVAIRADASGVIGTGHLVRCQALARELSVLGADVHFVTRGVQGGFHEHLRDAGLTVHLLRLDAAGEAVEDVSQVLDQDGHWDWLVIDHYGLDADAQVQWRPFVDRIAVIDDLADRVHDCDLLIDQNYAALQSDRYRELLPEGCQQLLGPRYALLRSAFAECREEAGLARSVVRRILVSFGGSDSVNATVPVLRSLRDLHLPNVAIDVLAGAANPHYHELRALCAGRSSWQLYRHVDDPWRIMAGADLVIGAGGGTTWERCCLGVPSVVVSVSDNQRENTRAMAADGYVLYLGDAVDLAAESITEAISLLVRNVDLRLHLSTSGRSLVDGLGASRCARALFGSVLRLRPADESDCLAVLRWRNAPESRTNSLSPRHLGENEHRQWFFETLTNPDRVLLIAESGDRPLGVLRYDISGEDALVSIFLVPGEQHKGYGVGILRAGERWVREHRPEVKTLEAQVLETNAVSRSTFEKAGFIGRQRTYARRLQTE